jgi:hypothetical protein
MNRKMYLHNVKIQVEYYSVDYVAKVIVKTFQRNDILNSFVNDKRTLIFPKVCN